MTKKIENGDKENLFAHQENDDLYLIKDAEGNIKMFLMRLNYNLCGTDNWALYSVGSEAPVVKHQYRNDIFEDFGIKRA